MDRPILGTDFPRHHGLLVDFQAQQLLNTFSMEVIYGSSASSSKSSSLYTALLSTPDPDRSLFGEYSELLGTGFDDLNSKHRLEAEKLVITKMHHPRREASSTALRPPGLTTCT